MGSPWVVLVVFLSSPLTMPSVIGQETSSWKAHPWPSEPGGDCQTVPNNRCSWMSTPTRATATGSPPTGSEQLAKAAPEPGLEDSVGGNHEFVVIDVQDGGPCVNARVAPGMDPFRT